MRLTGNARLLQEAKLNAEEIEELRAGELLEVVTAEGTLESEWLHVRSPTEEQIEIMSDKPLNYQVGWLHKAALEAAEHQLGERVAARIDIPNHPVLDIVKKLPPWQHRGELPSWMGASVAELHPGFIGGVVRGGKFLVQRPSGAMPERIATTADLIVVPKERLRRTVIAAGLGLALSCLIGSATHLKEWRSGESSDLGRVSWPKLVGWLSIVVLVLTPAAIVPCFGFVNSPASTTCAVAFINLLLYSDLFST